MPRPLPHDVRNRIIRAWQAGELTWQEIADRYGVSLASVNRLIRRYRQTGSVAPNPHAGGRRRLITDDGMSLIQRMVEEEPRRTLEELVALYANQTGVRPSITTMHRAVRRVRRSRSRPQRASA
jgi:transposase